MDEAVAARIEEQVRSLFPTGTFARVEVLGYGDDPAVEPGETALRAFIDRGGRAAGEDADKEVMEAFDSVEREGGRKLHDKLPPSIGWIEFRPDRPDSPDSPGEHGRHGPIRRMRLRGGRIAPLADEMAGEQLTPVMTRLGPDDLATVDTLITAGVAASRADALRWALSRIRERPAYAQLQQRVRDIEELKAQF
jgi:hypothetical protein